MAEQLVLLPVDDRSGSPRARAARQSGRPRARAARQSRGRASWHLDEHTVAVGRRGLQEARRALRRAAVEAA